MQLLFFQLTLPGVEIRAEMFSWNALYFCDMFGHGYHNVDG